MSMSPIYALIIAAIASIMTHLFSSFRFKNELTIKKKEKNINDAKDMISQYEKELVKRIYLTRAYLYDLIDLKIKNKEIDSSFRELYKKTISEWNLSLDYKYNVIYRSGMLGETVGLQKIQKNLKEFHDFINNNMKNKENLDEVEIQKQIELLKKFQQETYAFVSKLHHKADENWNTIFLSRSKIKYFFYLCFDYTFKTLVIYILLSITLFLYEFFVR
ncbi:MULTISPECIES: hypothetical protein [Providencia]|uniref:Uncharacterized protein n=1 Tax=Providencia huaxiensis TaxID=2027290 RepID=A0ABU2ISP0_9GAMM|nr:MULTISPECIES: hypothetical protein [Providencia]MBZ3681049.1 hypothetical protein [Providencia rettgeri]AXH63115.1 hypothetical protein CYG50_14390 [Providencia huaxiensis]MBQ0533718.1 hypothetical protein [Providencia huaxiensis]MBQ0589584.1 hypothetical protein [Providencia huaxiensis]MDI7239940.1 hypothetical protein [Providencia huaxiensis]